MAPTALKLEELDTLGRLRTLRELEVVFPSMDTHGVTLLGATINAARVAQGEEHKSTKFKIPRMF